MQWYLMAFQKYADFSSRSRRKEYWYFTFYHLLVMLVLFMLVGISDSFVYLLGLYALATFIPSLALTIRRLHDTGRSGWWYFIGLVPLVGAIVLLVFLIDEGEVGPNRWGPDPKAVYTGDITDHLVV